MDVLDNNLFKKEKPAYADFGVRLVATLLDSVFLMIALFVIAFLIFSVFHDSLTHVDDISPGIFIAGIVVYYILLPFSIFLYKSFFEASKYQGTPGKIILKLKVVNEYGQPISIWQSFGRNAARTISGMIFMIGYLFVLFTDKKQTLHDLIANTYVVQKSNGSGFVAEVKEAPVLLEEKLKSRQNQRSQLIKKTTGGLCQNNQQSMRGASSAGCFCGGFIYAF